MGAVLSATLLAVLIGGAAPASAQEATGVLEVTGASFSGPDGYVSTVGYPFGVPLNAFLDLRNPGTEPLTGVTGTLSFERGNVTVGTVAFPDIPAGETVRNSDPFVFSYGERDPVLDQGGGFQDVGCFIFFDGLDVGEDDVVIDETEGDVVTPTDPETDPSDPFEDIPPGGLVFTVTAEQGGIEYVHPWAAVCSMPAIIDSHSREHLPATGSNAVIGVIGGALSMLGAAMRRRARVR